MDLNEEITNTGTPSSQDTVEENYDWSRDRNTPIEYKHDYLKFPLEDWSKLAFTPNLNDSFVHSPGFLYESRATKVLKNDVFKDYEFYADKEGKLDFILLKHYKVDVNKLIKDFIVPDFFVHRIKTNKFVQLLQERRYMMKINDKIKITKAYVSIIGEIKTSHYQAHKKTKQREDYKTFIRVANLPKDEELLLMYVYDESYHLFKQDSIKDEKPNLILCYIPKIYLEECYTVYNNIITELGANIKPIDLKKIKFPKYSKREYIKLYESSEKKNKYLICTIFIMGLIIAILLKDKLNFSLSDLNQKTAEA